MSNIWIAAGEGDMARVKELVDSGLSPSIADENTYTPLHAAASWGQIEILRYLVSQGGDINVTDSDGETPLFVVETAEMARVVIELGGDINWKNAEGVTAAESLAEDSPHVSLYLRSLAAPATMATSDFDPNGTTDALTDSTSGAVPDLDAPTDALIARVRAIMEASERGELTSDETDDRLCIVVEEAVAGQVEAGRVIGEGMDVDAEAGEGTVRNREEEDAATEGTAKRSRADEAGR